ncbi:GSCOCG00010544001-RA-CDS, partial [Cotesia congregata]
MLTDSYESKCLRDFCNMHDLFLVPYAATHHTVTSDTWIDHCIVSDQAAVISSAQSDVPFLSGHDVISVNAQVLQTELPVFDRYITLDESVTTLNGGIRRVLDAIALERTIKVSRLPAPWLNDDIRGLQSRRDKLYRIFKRTGYAYAEYSNVRRLVKQRILAAKKDYLKSRIELHGSPKAIWNDFRRLGLLK